MALSELAKRASVLKAVAEFDQLGRDAFLRKYGFGKAREFFLEHEGKYYDSKAIVGAAHAYEFPQQGPLQSDNFSGGEATVQRKLEDLGFRVTVIRNGSETNRLRVGKVYTRNDLRRLFAINDATINTGVYRPNGLPSLWLFVTEQKSKDRTQYEDRLIGDVLYWQGQTQGRTDKLVIDHEAQRIQLDVFYRRRKYEHPGAGFRYEGPFRYISHTGSRPANFVLERVDQPLADAADEAEQNGAFDPTSVEDARRRTRAAIVRRRGQKKFRDRLLRAYDRRCAITGCDMEEVLEAAHIYPYKGAQTNLVSNGVLFRADIHTLFDLGMIALHPQTLRVIISERLVGTAYEELAQKTAFIPSKKSDQPSRKALEWHRKEAGLAK